MEQGFCYCYDGTFAGFLTCLYEIFAQDEHPAAFQTPGQPQHSLYPQREVVTRPHMARRVYGRLGQRLSKNGRYLLERGFLTCLPEREMHLYAYVLLGFQMGSKIVSALTDPRVLILNQAVGHLNREVQLLMGFVRFSDYRGLLVGEITPKNQVLPLLQTHFTDRLGGAPYLLHDATHHQAIFSQGTQWAIAPVEDFVLPAPDAQEIAYRTLWRRFYNTVSIAGRYNPKCRQTHMPKRYWENMTEFQGDTEETRALKKGMDNT